MSLAEVTALTATTSVPRLAFLGTGWIGRHRMNAVLSEGRAEAIAIYDPLPDMVAAAHEIAPAAAVAGSLEELLRSKPDGVVIATPSGLHAGQSIKALASGASVFCQKPLGRNAEEVSSVVSAAQRADRLLGVDLSYRHTNAMQAVRERLKHDDIGRLYAADLVFHNAYGPDKPWSYDARLSGGGCVIDLGIHLIDLLLWSLDFPAAVNVSSDLFASGHRAEPGEVEDYAVATLELETGLVARLACSWRLHAGCDAVIAATFHGTDGSLAFANVGGSFYDFVAELRRGTRFERLVEPPDNWGGRALVEWSDQLARENKFDPEANRHVQTAQILDRIYGP